MKIQFKYQQFRYRVVVKYRTGTDDEWKIKGSELAKPEADLYLYEHRG